MKSIKFWATCLVFLFSIGLHFSQSGEVLLQSTQPNLTETILAQAAEILVNRLKSAQVKVLTSDVREADQIHIHYQGELSKQFGSALLTLPGMLDFRETAEPALFFQQVPEGNPIYGLLKFVQSGEDKEEVYSGPLAHAAQADLANIEAQLKSLDLQSLEFAWGMAATSDDQIPLYLLKPLRDHSNDLKKINLVSCHASNGGIDLVFNEAGATRLSHLTQNNLNRALAVSLGDQILMAPIVRETIHDGRLQITGDYDDKDAASIAALLLHDGLPSTFRIVK